MTVGSKPSVVRAAGLHPWARRALFALLALLLVLLLLAAVGYRALWLRYGDARAQLDARIARLDGVLQAGSAIDARLADARREVQPWLFPGGEGAQNDAVQRLRELVVKSGGTLVSSQAALTPAGEGKLAHARLTATITGDWEQLVHLLKALQIQRPPFWTRSATLMREGADGPGMPQRARLAVQFDVPLAPAAQGARP